MADTTIRPGRGTSAKPANRPPDGISNLSRQDNAESNQQRFSPAGPIKPTALQPAQLSKRRNNVKLPANFSA